MEKDLMVQRSRFVVASTVFAFTAFLLLSAGVARAQQIGGMITDSTDASLPGTLVEARSPSMIEEVRTVVADGSRAPSQPIGRRPC